MKLCVTCGVALSEERLKAQPNAAQCTTCLEENGDEAPLRGAMIWDHKTAPYIEIGTAYANGQNANAHYGPHIHLSSGAVSNTSFGHKNHSVDAEPVVMHPARCHPERERATLKGLCLECALAKQKERLRCLTPG